MPYHTLACADEKGRKRLEGTFVAGAQHGTTTAWNEQGAIDRVVEYVKGEIVSVVEYQDGKPARIQRYRDGKPVGDF